jgi:hypothetical protein
MAQKTAFFETRAQREQNERLRNYYSRSEETSKLEKINMFALFLIVLLAIILLALLF